MRQDSYYENETKMTMIDWWCWFAVEHLMLFVGRESLVRKVCESVSRREREGRQEGVGRDDIPFSTSFPNAANS